MIEQLMCNVRQAEVHCQLHFAKEDREWERYRAAIELIHQIADAEENRKIGKVIHKSRFSDMKSKNATGNTGRIHIKRLYAVLTNRQLRQKYFGF